MRRQARETHGRQADALIDLYLEWREECSAVDLAYQRWGQASKDERRAAFAAYNAALDREERASNIYAALVREVSAAALQAV